MSRSLVRLSKLVKGFRWASGSGLLAGEEATRYLSFLVVRNVTCRRGVVRRLRLISADSTWVVLKGRWSIIKCSLLEMGNLGARVPKFRQADLLIFVYHKHSPPIPFKFHLVYETMCQAACRSFRLLYLNPFLSPCRIDGAR